MTQRVRAIWRLAVLFARESRVKSAADAPIHSVLRSFAAGVRSRGATRLTQRVPVLQNLSGVLGMASGLLAQHPGLAETAVRVALAELDALKTPLKDAPLRRALEIALPPGRAAGLIDVEAEPECCGIAQQTHRARIVLDTTPRSAGSAAPVAARITLIRADTRAELAQDLDVANSAVRLAGRFSREVREQNAGALIARLTESITGMLDLRQRAADQSFLRYRLREVNKDSRVVVPEVLWDFCSDTVLVTRAVRSVPLSDADGLRAHGLDPARLIATWIEVFFETALGEGVFHAGLEAAGAAVSIEPDTLGALVLDGDSPLTFFAAHERSFLVAGSHALLHGDHKAAAREHMQHGRPGEHEPQHAVRVEATYRREAERFAGDAQRHRTAADLFTALSKGPLEHAFGDAHTGIASRAALLARSVQSIEETARRLAPDIDVWSIARRVILRLALDQFSSHGLVAQLAKEAVHWPHALPRVPNLLHDWVMRQNRRNADSRSAR
ncbi:putative ubiquinone biosynthesis protein UbiB [Caballeronia udeis]|uniref:Putative ubiquinone biosynthesis protein UbiB n=1 Tax=Caballeronia udeis TaxID=1232866 RepID=A0A168GWA5_9BURK|nr:AarF/UbiB family protein [Caballeronia udeis]SAP34766.1 putative ubiquinone biosynthesis protein UbiB [Caballeronia udeis]